MTADVEICKAYDRQIKRENYQRNKQQELAAYSLDDENVPEAASAEDIEKEVELQQEIRKLRQAIRQLSPREQGFIIDYFFNGFSLRKLELKYGTSHTKIGREIKSALSQLRQYITDKND